MDEKAPPKTGVIIVGLLAIIAIALAVGCFIYVSISNNKLYEAIDSISYTGGSGTGGTGPSQVGPTGPTGKSGTQGPVGPAGTPGGPTGPTGPVNGTLYYKYDATKATLFDPGNNYGLRHSRLWWFDLPPNFLNSSFFVGVVFHLPSGDTPIGEYDWKFRNTYIPQNQVLNDVNDRSERSFAFTAYIANAPLSGPGVVDENQVRKTVLFIEVDYDAVGLITSAGSTSFRPGGTFTLAWTQG